VYQQGLLVAFAGIFGSAVNASSQLPIMQLVAYPQSVAVALSTRARTIPPA